MLSITNLGEILDHLLSHCNISRAAVATTPVLLAGARLTYLLRWLGAGGAWVSEPLSVCACSPHLGLNSEAVLGDEWGNTVLLMQTGMLCWGTMLSPGHLKHKNCQYHGGNARWPTQQSQSDESTSFLDGWYAVVRDHAAPHAPRKCEGHQSNDRV